MSAFCAEAYENACSPDDMETGSSSDETSAGEGSIENADDVVAALAHIHCTDLGMWAYETGLT